MLFPHHLSHCHAAFNLTPTLPFHKDLALRLDRRAVSTCLWHIFPPLRSLGALADCMPILVCHRWSLSMVTTFAVSTNERSPPSSPLRIQPFQRLLLLGNRTWARQWEAPPSPCPKTPIFTASWLSTVDLPSSSIIFYVLSSWRPSSACTRLSPNCLLARSSSAHTNYSHPPFGGAWARNTFASLRSVLS